MKIISCLFCEKEVPNNSRGNKKYCSEDHRKKAELARYYKGNSKRLKLNTHNWIKNNREKFNSSIIDSYYKNKNKWQSRHKTLSLTKVKKHSHLFPDKSCHDCGSKKNIQIHHEVYPIRANEILKRPFVKGKSFSCVESVIGGITNE